MKKEFCPYTSPITLILKEVPYWGCCVNYTGKCSCLPKKDYETCEDFQKAEERVFNESELILNIFL